MEIQSTIPDPAPYQDISIGQFLMRKIEELLNNEGDKVAIRDVSNGHVLQYSDLEPMSRRVGSALTRMGFKPQDTLIFVASNCCEIFPILFGVWRLNGITRPSYPEDTQETLMNRMKESECRFVICEDTTASAVLSVCSRLDWPVKVFSFDESDGCIDVDILFGDNGKEFPETIDIDPDDLVTVLCTGGTTGPSKGAVMSHRRFLACMANGPWLYPKATNGKVMSTIRVFHMGGSVFVPLLLARGIEIQLMSNSTPQNFLSGIHQYRPSVVAGFNTSVMWAGTYPRAKDYDLTSVKSIGIGGSPITKSIIDTIRQSYPNLKQLHRGYGMTESFMISSTIDGLADIAENEETPEFKGTPAESCGLVVPGLSLKVVDIDTGETLGANQQGELLVRGCTLMTHYYKNPEATTKTFRDGWLLTGDRGYYDNNGFLYIVDRIKESFKYWNYHISPVELEDVIMKHPDIREACVIGIPDPDGGDSIPRAYVVKLKGSDLDEETLKNYVHGKVASYMHLRGGVMFVDEIPRSQAGKISRPIIRKLFLEGLM